VSKKIPVSQTQTPLSGNPFASLEIGGLPPGPEEVPVEKRPAKNELGRIVLRREKAHRGGKTVIVASGFHDGIELESLARRAKQSCGCGGTVSGREIELQGDDAGRVRAFFEREGFRVAGV